MKETDRNAQLFLLLNKLVGEDDLEAIKLIKTLVDKDTPSMQKTYEIMTKEYLKNIGKENFEIE